MVLELHLPIGDVVEIRQHNRKNRRIYILQQSRSHSPRVWMWFRRLSRRDGRAGRKRDLYRQGDPQRRRKRELSAVPANSGGEGLAGHAPIGHVAPAVSVQQLRLHPLQLGSRVCHAHTQVGGYIHTYTAVIRSHSYVYHLSIICLCCIY